MNSSTNVKHFKIIECDFISYDKQSFSLVFETSIKDTKNVVSVFENRETFLEFFLIASNKTWLINNS